MNHEAPASVERSMMEKISGHTFKRSQAATFYTQSISEGFDEKFPRCLGPLHFIACRVLGGSEGADVAVRKCWRTASRNPRKFDREGEFRSWLLRVLIDEALAILNDRRRGHMGSKYVHPRSLHSALS